MFLNRLKSTAAQAAKAGLVSAIIVQLSIGSAFAADLSNLPSRDSATKSPIKHVIVIIGENRSFDHVFATYVPRRGQTVHNLLSEGIIQLDANKNAIPGPNFRKAQQLSASDLGGQDAFLLSPPKQEFPNNQLPLPEVGGPSGADGFFTPSSSADTTVSCGTTAVNGKTTTNFSPGGLRRREREIHRQTQPTPTDSPSISPWLPVALSRKATRRTCASPISPTSRPARSS